MFNYKLHLTLTSRGPGEYEVAWCGFAGHDIHSQPNIYCASVGWLILKDTFTAVGEVVVYLLHAYLSYKIVYTNIVGWKQRWDLAQAIWGGCTEVLYWGEEDQCVDTGKRTVISDDGIKFSFMNSKHSYKKAHSGPIPWLGNGEDNKETNFWWLEGDQFSSFDKETLCWDCVKCVFVCVDVHVSLSVFICILCVCMCVHLLGVSDCDTVCAEISAVCKFRGHLLIQRKFNPWKFASLQQLEICDST